MPGPEADGNAMFAPGSIEDNRLYYEQYDWSFGGVEWSQPWGGTRSMWLASLYPRLCGYLPAERVVEIGCGHGRIARILHAFTYRELLLFDIVDGCIDACRKTFSTSTKTHCRLTDGRSLPGVADRSVDLVVSFYSLVGADAETIDAYIRECSRVLTDDGVAFIHHSNAAVYYDAEAADRDDRMPLLAAYRDVSTSAASVARQARDNDLVCVHQECVDWDMDHVLTDCFSTIVRPGSKWVRPNEIVHNTAFRAERALAARRNAHGSKRENPEGRP